MPRRWLVLALGLPVYAAVLAVLATAIGIALEQQDWSTYDWGGLPGDVTDVFGHKEWWTVIGLPTLVAVASQAVFLVPVFARRPPRGERSRPLLVSLGIGGAIAAVLTLALVMAVVEVVTEEMDAPWIDDLLVEAALITLLVGSWCFWSGLLLVFARDIWADRLLGRLIGMLLAGTLLELLVIVPLDIMVRRRTDCYCWSGTYFALCLAAAVTLWLAGPGIMIALCSKKHRMWRETHCQRCGYPKGPSPGPHCPECGFAWPRRGAERG